MGSWCVLQLISLGEKMHFHAHVEHDAEKYVKSSQQQPDHPFNDMKFQTL